MILSVVGIYFLFSRVGTDEAKPLQKLEEPVERIIGKTLLNDTNILTFYT